MREDGSIVHLMFRTGLIALAVVAGAMAATGVWV